VVYAIYLVATKSALLTLESWPPKVLAHARHLRWCFDDRQLHLSLAFLRLAAGSTYEPAHVEDGKFVPGRVVR
jgi:hypothetical protein